MMQTTQFVTYAIAGIIGLGYLTGSKSEIITRPVQGATYSYDVFPTSIKVQATQPVSVQLFSGSAMVSSAEITASPFTAFLEVQGPGPHEIRYTYMDSARRTFTGTVSFLIKDLDVTEGFDFSKALGVNYLSPVVRRRETAAAFIQGIDPCTRAYEEEWLDKLQALKVNFIRVPVRWESMVPYPANQANVLQQLEWIAEECETRGIAMVVENHYVWEWSGLPAYIKAGYADYGQFFKDLYDNTLQFGDYADEVENRFFKPIIDRIDKYSSVKGYEISNEPSMLPTTTYTQLGNYHTRIGQRIRAHTNKAVIFGQAIPRNGGAGTTAANLAVTFPQCGGDVVYAPHCYKVSGFDTEMNEIKQTQQLLGNIPVFLGEHAPGLSSTNGAFNTQANHRMQIQGIRNNGFGDCYWGYAPNESIGFHDLTTSTALTATGTMYFAARREVYGY